MTLRIGVVGATGYTGHQLLQLIKRHPQATLAWATSESSAGKRINDLYATTDDTPLIRMADAPMHKVDAVFLCLPHKASMEAVAEARHAGVVAIDLSADYRLPDTATYEQWYGHTHTQPDLLREAVYGLCEVNRSKLAAAKLIANPGCYPTTVNLGLWPLATAGILHPRIIVDAKSGISGAGRKPRLNALYVEANENMSPYNVGYSHRHIAEMELILGQHVSEVEITFAPHLLPINRGILSTIYISLDPSLEEDSVRQIYHAAYAAEPFIHLLPSGQLATIKHTAYTNHLVIGLTQLPRPGQWIVTVSEDNLLKGASGQAVQNLNLAFDMPETLGLL